MTRKYIVAITATSMLVGCSTPWPLEPQFDRKELAERATSVPQDYSDIDSAKKITDEWRKVMRDASRDRRKQELVISELVFYGTLLLTGGQAWLAKSASSKDALRMRNIGVGTATGANLLDGHYKFKDQRIAFEKAEERMACLNRALSPVPTAAEWSDYRASGTNFDKAIQAKMPNGETVATVYLGVPRQALEFIEGFVQPSLKADLAEISLATPSREEIIAAAKKYTEDKAAGADAVTKAAPGITKNNQETDAQRAARQENEALLLKRQRGVEAIASFGAALALCKT